MSEIAETELYEPPEVDPLGPDVQWANLAPMCFYLATTGAVLTLAARRHWTWAYVLGLVLTVVWVLGFVVVRNRRDRRWFYW